jgi:hypothetical protein
MAGEGCSHANVGRLFVANFADNQDLWVLPKQVPGGFSKIEPARFVHFSLHHPWHNLFGRIFDGDDMPAAETDQVEQAGIDGGGFATSGRASEQ